MVQVFPYRVIEIKGPTKDNVSAVNVHRLKHFLEMPCERDVECLLLNDPLSF